MNVSNSIELARKVRIHAVKMVNRGGSSHIASILSTVDILSVLYGKIMNYRSSNPKWKNRDRFILSKGHAGAGVYAVLAESGFFKVSELENHYKDGSIFSGHVSHKGVPGVELSTGSLGHGLSVAAGVALAAKINKNIFKVFVLMSDGELDEGSNWEALMFSSHHNLNNLTAIIDRNFLQSIESTENTLTLEPLKDKLIAFGWNVIEVDGHDHYQLIEALNSICDKPKIIIANTIKGKGVSFMENDNKWHYQTPLGENFEKAIQELEAKK